MNDMASVIVPKSDQINADDLIAGPMTITIRDVQIKGGQEQPVSIYFDGSDKAFRPCKSMSRVLVQAWGADAKAYIGRTLVLYRDPEVKWGGLAVGGIRISHMSHIDGPKQMMLTATKGSRKPHRVLPIVQQGAAPTTPTGDAAERWAGGYIANLAAFTTVAEVQAFAAEKAAKLAELESKRPDLHEKVTIALATRTADLTPATSDFSDDDMTPPDNVSVPTDEKSAAETSVEAYLTRANEAADEAALEAIIAEAEPHKAFMTDELAIKLEIGFDKARKAHAEGQGALSV